MEHGQSLGRNEIVVPLGLLALVGCMVIPLPPWALDIFLCSNLLFALLLVIGALHIRDPLRLTTLPSLLLMATLVRLSLNLATTRAVLGTGDAGRAVEAFGLVVTRGNLLVGFILFLLITLIQFIVVAKGAERVAEVSARFTLDAMPGKQMAIDAELRSGLIDPEAARRRRGEVQTESRFYGALDGAMKFVKGDAIAGLVITFVNISGGLLVGLLVHHLDLEVALHRYTLLTIGDSLLSQIPSLLNSVAAGLVVTRVQASESSSLSSDLISQLSQFRVARLFVAGASLALGCFPGMPHLALFGVASVVGVSLVRSPRRSPSNEPAMVSRSFEPSLSSTIQLEVAQDWLAKAPGLTQISDALEELRAYAFQRWGIVLHRPSISTWSEPTAGYQILVRGMEVSVDAGGGNGSAWENLVNDARGVIDQYRADLIDDGATRRALDYVERSIPDLVSGVVPAVVSLTQLTAILRALLKEGITTRHMDVILQVLAEHGGKMSDRALLAEVRAALAPVVCGVVAGDGIIRGVAVEPLLDLALAKAEESGTLISGELVDAICSKVSEVMKPGAVLITSKRSRAYLRDVVRIRGSGAQVIAHEELAPRYQVVQSGILELSETSHRAALMSAVM
jgi:type III secretion protein V